MEESNELKRNLKRVWGESEVGLDFVHQQKRRGRPKKIKGDLEERKDEGIEKVQKPEFKEAPSCETEVVKEVEGDPAKKKRHRRKSIPQKAPS